LTNLALAGDTLYLVTCDLPLTYTSLQEPIPTKAAGPATGEVEAVNLATGKVEWDTKLPQLPLGAATVPNDLVFTRRRQLRCPSVGSATPEAVSPSRSCWASRRFWSFLSDWFSIWRMRSRVTLNVRPTSSSVHGGSPPSP
jgi:hypothetical protein